MSDEKNQKVKNGVKKEASVVGRVIKWVFIAILALTVGVLTSCLSKSKVAEKHCATGENYLQKEEYALALKEFNKAIEVDPNFVRAYYNRGQVYYLTEKKDSALNEFQKALEIDLNFIRASSVNAYIGMIYLEKGDDENALVFFNKSIEIEVNNKMAIDGIREIEAKKAKAEQERLAAEEKRRAEEEKAAKVAKYHGKNEFSKTFANLSNPYSFEENDEYYLGHVIPARWLNNRTYMAYCLMVSLFGDQESPFFYIDIGNFKPSDISKNTIMGTDFGQALVVKSDGVFGSSPKFKLVRILEN